MRTTVFSVESPDVPEHVVGDIVEERRSCRDAATDDFDEEAREAAGRS